jgi:proteasome lid subunit RPN8/RPN11
MTSPNALPDVRQLAHSEDDSEGGKTPFPGAGPQDFRIYFRPEAHRTILEHARETTAVEICGVLVGRWGRDDDGPYVAVTEVIRCDAAASKSGEVTFTHEAWNVINREMDTRFAELKIVGWYHSHPGFGVFLSDRDRFIQEHFFSNPGQIAHVVDPRTDTEGVFAWRDGQPTLWPHFWIGRRICAVREEPGENTAGLDGSADAALPSAAARRDEISILSLLQKAALYIIVFLIGYLLAGGRSAWEERMIVQGAFAQYGILNVMNLGLRDNLESADVRLAAVDKALHFLAAEPAKKDSKDAKSRSDEWKTAQKNLQETRILLKHIADRYALSPEDEIRIKQILTEKLAKLEEMKPPPSPRAESSTKEKDHSETPPAGKPDSSSSEKRKE